MGEGQWLWEDVEIAMSIAFEENQCHASDNAYVDDHDDLTSLHTHVEARVPDTGKIYMLMCGGCEQEFFSQSGLSTRCILGIAGDLVNVL